MRNKILYLITLLFCFTSCETYKDNFDIEYSPIFPIAGEWAVKVYEADTLTYKGFLSLYTYNTSDNSSTEMWIDFRSTLALVSKFRGKIGCSVPNRSFSNTDALNNYFTPNTGFSITNGLVELGAFATNSGGRADKISFNLSVEQLPGRIFYFEGFRKTGWEEDEDF